MRQSDKEKKHTAELNIWLTIIEKCNHKASTWILNQQEGLCKFMKWDKITFESLGKCFPKNFFVCFVDIFWLLFRSFSLVGLFWIEREKNIKLKKKRILVMTHLCFCSAAPKHCIKTQNRLYFSVLNIIYFSCIIIHSLFISAQHSC